MSLVVVVEGPDLVGKTSVLDELQRRRPFSLWPRILFKAPRELLTEDGGQVLDRTSLAFYDGLIVMKKSMSFVMDRGYVSNYVYSTVLGRRFDEARLRFVASALRPVVVLLWAPEDELVMRLNRRGDRFVDESRLRALARAYDDWWRKNPFGDFVVRYYHGNQAVTRQVVDQIVVDLELGVPPDEVAS